MHDGVCLEARESLVTRFSSDPPLTCRHRDGCRNGSVFSPGDPRRWRAHRHTILEVLFKKIGLIKNIDDEIKRDTKIIEARILKTVHTIEEYFGNIGLKAWRVSC